MENAIKIEYEVQRSGRKTFAISITKDLKVLVKSPLEARVEQIEQVINRHIDWIEEHVKMMKMVKEYPVLSQEEYRQCVERAKVLVADRVKHFSKIMGVKPTSVKITSAEKRWGSCSSRNGLCFSYSLALLPIELVDLIVVHELMHILVMNHSDEFYEKFALYMPDYEHRNKTLREFQKSMPIRSRL